MMQFVLSPEASQTMNYYFENYTGSQSNNDMNQRAYKYSRILKCLSQINILDSYVVNGKNFVDIDDICRVEYEVSNNEEQVVIMNIYFNQDNDESDDLTPILNLWIC